MLSKSNILIFKELEKQLKDQKLNYECYENLPQINEDSKLKNFIVHKSLGNDYLNSKNIIESNKLIIYVKNFENMGNSNTPELAVNIALKVLKDFAISLPIKNALNYDEEINYNYIEIDYKTYC